MDIMDPREIAGFVLNQACPRGMVSQMHNKSTNIGLNITNLCLNF